MRVDLTERPEYNEVFERAVAVALQALTANGATATSDAVAEALHAAAKVFAADDQAYADKLIAETGLAGIDIVDGDARMRLVLANELAAKMTLAFRTILDANPGATNYVEQTVIDRNTGDRYIFIVCKPRGKTPHQLRQDAETERDRAATLNRQAEMERDQNEKWASRLAAAISHLTGVDIGPALGRDNNPWDNALQAAAAHGAMVGQHKDPVSALQKAYDPESYNAGDYLVGAVPLLVEGGWLSRPVTQEDLATVKHILNGLYNTDLDETDVYPFGMVWALRCTGAIGPLPGLDAQLTVWRHWEETEHLGEALTFLPELPQ